MNNRWGAWVWSWTFRPVLSWMRRESSIPTTTMSVVMPVIPSFTNIALSSAISSVITRLWHSILPSGVHVVLLLLRHPRASFRLVLLIGSTLKRLTVWGGSKLWQRWFEHLWIKSPSVLPPLLVWQEVDNDSAIRLTLVSNVIPTTSASSSPSSLPQQNSSVALTDWTPVDEESHLYPSCPPLIEEVEGTSS